jgi:hypothetical protein
LGTVHGRQLTALEAESYRLALVLALLFFLTIIIGGA